MLNVASAAVLDRLLEATKQGRITWQKDPDGWFKAGIGSHNEYVLMRQIFMEATNQIGADPYFVEFTMPGWNTRFTIADDSEGWRRICGILNAAFPDGWHSQP